MCCLKPCETWRFLLCLAVELFVLQVLGASLYVGEIPRTYPFYVRVCEFPTERMAAAQDLPELGPRVKKVLAQCGEDGSYLDLVCSQRCNLTRAVAQHGEVIRNMRVRPSDIWVITYPRSGTTWTQEMCWLLCNSCNLEVAKSHKLTKRFVFLEFSINFPAHSFPIELVDSIPETETRFFKSHLPVELLPKELFVVKPKIIYVARDPRDVVVSYYHLARTLNKYKGNFEDFLDAFSSGELLYGQYWSHVLGFWNMQKHEDCILFLTYEDLKRDLRAVVQRLATFLEASVLENKEEELLQHLGFQAMKKNPMVNYGRISRADGDGFIRKGEAGGWREMLTPEQCLHMNQWASEWLRGSDYPHYDEFNKPLHNTERSRDTLHCRM